MLFSEWLSVLRKRHNSNFLWKTQSHFLCFFFDIFHCHVVCLLRNRLGTTITFNIPEINFLIRLMKHGKHLDTSEIIFVPAFCTLHPYVLPRSLSYSQLIRLSKYIIYRIADTLFNNYLHVESTEYLLQHHR